MFLNADLYLSYTGWRRLESWISPAILTCSLNIAPSEPARGHEGDHIFASKTPASETWGRWAWISRGGKTSPTIGEVIYIEGWSDEMRNEGVPLERSVLDGKTTTRRQRAESVLTCIRDNRDCHSRVGLYNHNRCCSSISRWGLTLWGQIQGFSTPTDVTHVCIMVVV